MDVMLAWLLGKGCSSCTGDKATAVTCRDLRAARNLTGDREACDQRPPQFSWNDRLVMNNLSTHQPLTKDELDRLADFLGAINPPALNLESLDGYFAALICDPDVVLPSEHLPEIWGEDYSFASNEQASEVMGLLMGHWNTIASTLRRTLEVPGVLAARAVRGGRWHYPWQRMGAGFHARDSYPTGKLAPADRKR
jgi:Uncharacterised protein family (UPF0149)